MCFFKPSSGEARTTRNLGILFLFFFMSPEFHELWCSMITVCSLKLSGNGLRQYWDG